MQAQMDYRGGASTLAAPVTGLDTAGSVSAVSWAAIIAGGVTAVAVTLILLSLGGGIGLTTISPWGNRGVSAASFGIGAAIWLIVVQWISAGFGGYIAGRLRTKWVGIHTDEVFFRDTAHGFLAWALATVIGAAFLASVTLAAAGGGARALSSVAAGAAQGATQAAGQAGTNGPMGYYIDTLFRSDQPQANANANAGDVRAETTRLLTVDLANGDLPAADRTYLAQRVAAQTGVSQADAEARVDNVVTQIKAAEVKARQAADAARKATATLSIMTALALVIGAFIAAASGALGGRLRDEY